MRYALVSDIHANWQAWRAVHTDIGASRVDAIICLGDIIGYGPRPAEVLHEVYRYAHHFTMGNHEAALLGLMDVNLFNGAAKEVIQWTGRQLNSRAMKTLRTMPLTVKGEGFRCAHADFSEPGQFLYVIDPPDAAPSWQQVPESLLFVGHTHRPGIFLLGESGTPRRVNYQDVVIEPDRRYLINVGSVGQPRDKDARACYVIYDSDQQAVFFRRVPFDLDAYRQDLNQAGIPKEASPFLNFDPAQQIRPIREVLGFRPAARSEAVSDAVEVMDLQKLQGRVTRWRKLTLLLAVLIAVLVVGGWAWWQRAANRKQVIDRISEASTPARWPAAVPAVAGIPGWRLELGNRYRQQTAFRVDSEYGPVLVVKSDDPTQPIVLSAGMLPVQASRRFQVSAYFKERKGFDGHAAIQVALIRERNAGRERVENFLVKEPTMKRSGGWMKAQQTESVLAGTVAAEFKIVLQFTGQLEVAAPVLEWH